MDEPHGCLQKQNLFVYRDVMFVETCQICLYHNINFNVTTHMHEFNRHQNSQIQRHDEPVSSFSVSPALVSGGGPLSD